MSDRSIAFELNGRPVEVRASAHRTLLFALREELGATDVKYGCGEGVCGTCTVLLDGQTVNACAVLAVQATGRSVTTLAGLDGRPGGLDGSNVPDELHPLQRSFLEHGAAQCGFCTPGMILTVFEFVRDHPGEVDRDAIRGALSGNLCRCTGYTKIVDAAQDYAREVASSGG